MCLLGLVTFVASQHSWHQTPLKIPFLTSTPCHNVDLYLFIILFSKFASCFLLAFRKSFFSLFVNLAHVGIFLLPRPSTPIFSLCMYAQCNTNADRTPHVSPRVQVIPDLLGKVRYIVRPFLVSMRDVQEIRPMESSHGEWYHYKRRPLFVLPRRYRG